jgi:hypothetical protein
MTLKYSHDRPLYRLLIGRDQVATTHDIALLLAAARAIEYRGQQPTIIEVVPGRAIQMRLSLFIERIAAATDYLIAPTSSKSPEDAGDKLPTQAALFFPPIF